MSSNIKEKILLLRLQKRDPEAFAQLYDLYVASIYRFILFKVPTRQDAEDLTSEVFLKTWQYIGEAGNNVGNFRSLLYASARNLVVDFYRRRSQGEMIGDEEVLLQLEDSRQQNFLNQIDAKADVKNLESCLRRLKDEYRDVIILRFLDELSISEIAEVLNKSKGSVRVLIHRALKVVKELISQS